jgi:hypothetical protein
VTRYRFIDQAKQTLGARRCCRVLGVSTSGYYDWRRRAHHRSTRSLDDQRLLAEIGRIHRASGGVYGAPRVHAELRLGRGVRVGRKRVARLMRAAGLVGVHRRRRWRPGLTRRDPRAMPAPDLVGRQFGAAAPDRVWHADYTELPTEGRCCALPGRCWSRPMTSGRSATAATCRRPPWPCSSPRPSRRWWPPGADRRIVIRAEPHALLSTTPRDVTRPRRPARCCLLDHHRQSCRFLPPVLPVCRHGGIRPASDAPRRSSPRICLARGRQRPRQRPPTSWPIHP